MRESIDEIFARWMKPSMRITKVIVQPRGGGRPYGIRNHEQFNNCKTNSAHREDIGIMPATIGRCETKPMGSFKHG